MRIVTGEVGRDAHVIGVVGLYPLAPALDASLREKSHSPNARVALLTNLMLLADPAWKTHAARMAKSDPDDDVKGFARDLLRDPHAKRPQLGPLA